MAAERLDDVEQQARRAADEAFPPVSRRTATLVNLSYTYASVGVNVVRGIVLPPLFLEFIADRTLGIWFALSNVLNWIMMSEGGAWLLLRQQTAREFGRGDRTALAEAIGVGGFLLFVLGALVAGACIGLAPFAPGWFDTGGETGRVLALSFAVNGLALALSLPACIPRAVQQGLQRQVGVNVALLLAEIVSVIATIVLLIRGWGVLAIAVGILAREVLHNLFNWPLLVHSLWRLRIRPRFAVGRLRTTVPLMGWTFLSNIGASLRSSVDAFVIGKFLAPELVPATEFSKRIWDLAMNLLMRVSNAFSPGMAHLHGEGDTPRFRAVAGRLLAVLALATGIVLAGGWALNAAFMNIWLPRPLHLGVSYDVAFGVATLLTLLSMMMNDVLFAAGCIRGPSIVSVAQTLLRIAALLLLVGVVGALAMPLSIVAAIVLGGGWYMVQQWRRTLELSRSDAGRQLSILAACAGSAAVVAGLWSLVPVPTSWTMLGVQAMAVAVCTGAVAWVVGGALREQLQPMVAAVANRLARRFPHAGRDVAR